MGIVDHIDKALDECNEMENKLIELCIDIFAHCDLDFEIDVKGNSYNACECVGVARRILEILGIDEEEINDEIEERMEEIDY